MTFRSLLSGIFLIFTISHFSVSAAESNPNKFLKSLLQESGLQIDSPPDFKPVELQHNPLLAYEHALRHSSNQVELRFIIRPLKRISIDYVDPHNAVPEPNHLFPLLFESITNQLSSNSNTPNTAFSSDESLKHFNAHWAAVSTFDINPKFSNRYQQGILIGIHKNELADAYTLFMFNDYAQAKPIIDDAFSALTFIR